MDDPRPLRFWLLACGSWFLVPSASRASRLLVPGFGLSVPGFLSPLIPGSWLPVPASLGSPGTSHQLLAETLDKCFHLSDPAIQQAENNKTVGSVFFFFLHFGQRNKGTGGRGVGGTQTHKARP